MLALVDMHDCANKRAEAEDTDLKTAAEQVTQLFDDLESTIYDPSLGRWRQHPLLLLDLAD